MLVKSFAALAALAFAANVAAEPKPYKPSMVKTSARDLFGIVRRQDEGYQPDEAACGEGNTCAEACGAGYETCAPANDQIHCFNPTVGEICCPDLSGSSCEAGYYCTADTQGETWCCPEGMDLATCASEYGIDGGLVSQTPAPVTSTSTSSSTSSTSAPATTTTATTVAQNTTSFAVESSTSGSFLPSASSVQSNTTSVSTVKPAQPTESKVEEGAGSVVGPATALVLLAAGFAALL
jgi:hypothetical protein